MDKDPIREEAEKQYDAKTENVCDCQDECHCYWMGVEPYLRARFIPLVEKHLREKAELQQDLTALRSHNLELVEALKHYRDEYEICGYGDIAEKALSSPQSEKYLKMVRVMECVEGLDITLDENGDFKYMTTAFIIKLFNALKSYNSEKGGE